MTARASRTITVRRTACQAILVGDCLAASAALVRKAAAAARAFASACVPLEAREAAAVGARDWFGATGALVIAAAV